MKRTTLMLDDTCLEKLHRDALESLLGEPA
jgi:hypothetical protein